MRRRFVVTLLCLLAARAVGQNAQAILPHDSDVILLIDSIYREQGMTLPSTAGPFSVDEVQLWLARIDGEVLSTAGQKALSHVREELAALAGPGQSDGFAVAVHPAAFLEAYLHTNPQSTAWEYNYNERRPLVALPLGLWALDGFYGAFDLALKEGHVTVDNILQPPVLTNIPFDLRYLDYEFPFRALAAVGGGHWSAVIGRDRFGWGNAHTGNLALSDYPDYYDFARVTVYWTAAKYAWLWIDLGSRLDGSINNPPATAAGNANNTLPRNLFAQRLELRLFDRVSLAGGEEILLGGVEPDLRYLNPFMILHNFYNWQNSSAMLFMEADVNPWRYFDLYGQVAFNQINSVFEELYYPQAVSEIPDAYAWLLGVRSSAPVSAGYLDFGGELAYISPWMYIRESFLTSFSWDRFMDNNYPVAGYSQWLVKPFGYWLGPDSRVLAFWAGYRWPGLAWAEIEARYQQQGQLSLENDTVPYGTAAAALTTPTGIPETRLVVMMTGELSPLPWLSLGTSVAWVRTWNLGHVNGVQTDDLQVVLSVGVH